MSYFDDASLVMIPSGYKNAKVYSVKPTDGTGDLTFSRASGATRVGPDGLIEKVRTNLIPYSNDFTNAAYEKITDGTYTITSETITDPFGNSLAVQKVTLTSGGFLVLRNLLGTATTSPTTGSVYIKKTTSTTVVRADLSDAFVATAADNTNWQRLVSTNTASVYGSGTFLDISITTANQSVYVAYAQIELSDFGATPYIATTTAAVSVGPVSGLPRLDYLGSTCPKLLLEPQRTNSVPYSEQIDNASWSKLNTTVSANQAVSPDGTTSADLVYPTTTGTDRLIEKAIGATIGQTWTSSFFVKASGFSWVLIYSPNLVACWFNASTGTFGTVGAGVTAIVLGQVNGFWRVSFTETVPSAIAYFYAGVADANGSIVATTSGTNGILIWGCQLEQGSYATSYIPTLTTTVTRVADAASKTGISSLIGQTEGTVFYDGFYGNEINEVYLFLQKASSSGVDDSIYIQQSSGAIALNVYSGATQQTFIIGSAPTLGQRIKIAAGYKANDFVLYVNGTQIGTDTSGAVPTCDTLQVGSYRATPTAANFIAVKGINQALLFPTRLTNSQLAELTA
jgi:hypothetical protein